MRMTGANLTHRGLAALALATLFATVAQAEDPCAAFTWDVSHERGLSAAAVERLGAARLPSAAPALALDKVYELRLFEQSQVTFALPPAKKPSSDAAYAGLARLTLNDAGVYRLSLDRAAWVDVIANGAAIPSQDSQGRPGCDAPHKIVEFVLPAGTALTLQFSASAAATLRIGVTRSPRRL